jgi:hypothetical protein
MEARAGEQTGDAQKKFSKRNPVAANRSRLGVRISVLPAHPIAQYPWSSVNIKSKLICSDMIFIPFVKDLFSPQYF